jgi:hypothetical protein
MKGANRVLWGIVLLVTGFFLLLYTYDTRATLTDFETSLTPSALIMGIACAILGFVLYIDGRTIQKQEKTNKREMASIGHTRPSKNAIPEKQSLEVPAKKRCPACKKYVYKDARVCRFCGNQFAVSYRLKVYRPPSEQNRRFLVETLSKHFQKPPDEIDHLLEMGMRFTYSDYAHLDSHRKKFERLGCKTEVYEKVARE